MLRRGGLWKMVGTLDAKRVEVFEKGSFEWGCEIRQRHSAGSATPDRFVIHIRQVHHAVYLESPVFKVALQEVFENVGAEISDMGKIVNRGAACVEAHLAMFAWREVFDPATQCIEKTQWHGDESKGGAELKIKFCLRSVAKAPYCFPERILGIFDFLPKLHGGDTERSKGFGSGALHTIICGYRDLIFF